MTYNSNLSKIIKKSIEKNRQAFLNKKKTKPKLVQHGLFLFETGCTLQKSIESSRIERCKHEEQMLQLMHMYQEYHDIVSTRQYASRGSKLVCQYGTKPALLDTLMDHGVYAGTRPVMTCLDCRKENLHDFGSCMCPERLYKGRLPMTVAVHRDGSMAKRAPYNKYPHICVPLVDMQAGWHQTETGVLVEAAEGIAIQALLEGAFLGCQYGGIITIPEVPVDEEETTEGRKVKKYVVVSKAVRVRKCYTLRDDCPDDCPIEREKGGCDIKGGKNKLAQLTHGKRVNVIFEGNAPVTKKNDGHTWLKIEYEHDMGETAWIAEDFVLPDETVVTDKFPEKVVRYVNGIPDITKTLIEDWGRAGGGTYTGMDILTEDKKRYQIAVGPKVLNPKYSDTGKLEDDDFEAYTKEIEVELVKKDDNTKTWTLQCYRKDLKAHTYNNYPDGHEGESSDKVEVHDEKDNLIENGLVQTGIRYPKASGDQEDWARDHFDGSIVEFCSDDSCIEIIEKNEFEKMKKNSKNAEYRKLSDYKLKKVEAHFVEE